MRTIYRIFFYPFMQSYIGQTGNLSQRQQMHLSNLRRGHHPSDKLQQAYNKHGEAIIRFEALEENIPDDKGKEREGYWITLLDSVDGGFNTCFSGSERYGKECEWNGVKYRSVKLAAKANNINYFTLLERINRGYTCEDDVPMAWRKPKKG